MSEDYNFINLGQYNNIVLLPLSRPISLQKVNIYFLLIHKTIKINWWHDKMWTVMYRP